MGAPSLVRGETTGGGAGNQHKLGTLVDFGSGQKICLRRQLLKSVRSLGAEASAEHVYKISFELLPWTDFEK